MFDIVIELRFQVITIYKFERTIGLNHNIDLKSNTLHFLVHFVCDSMILIYRVERKLSIKLDMIRRNFQAIARNERIALICVLFHSFRKRKSSQTRRYHHLIRSLFIDCFDKTNLKSTFYIIKSISSSCFLTFLAFHFFI